MKLSYLLTLTLFSQIADAEQPVQSKSSALYDKIKPVVENPAVLLPLGVIKLGLALAALFGTGFSVYMAYDQWSKNSKPTSLVVMVTAFAAGIGTKELIVGGVTDFRNAFKKKTNAEQ